MGLLRRTVALQLAIALPTVVGARLALDIRSAPNAERHVEAEHGDACAEAHDHTLCALIFSTPWSDAPPAPHVEPSSPPEVTAPLVASICDREAQIRLAYARAPPSFIQIT